MGTFIFQRVVPVRVRESAPRVCYYFISIVPGAVKKITWSPALEGGMTPSLCYTNDTRRCLWPISVPLTHSLWQQGGVSQASGRLLAAGEWKDIRIRPASVWKPLCNTIFYSTIVGYQEHFRSKVRFTSSMREINNITLLLYVYYSLTKYSFQNHSNYSNQHTDSWATGGDDTRITKSIFLLSSPRAPEECVPVSNRRRLAHVLLACFIAISVSISVFWYLFLLCNKTLCDYLRIMLIY